MASDIHIELDSLVSRVRFRIDGILQEVLTANPSGHPAIVSRVKVMSRMDIAERRLPQDGRIKLRIQGKEIDLRVSTVPTMHGESVVMRILDKGGVPLDFASLGFEPAPSGEVHGVAAAAARHPVGDRPDRQRQDDNALHSALNAKQAGREDHHRGGPGRVPDDGHQPDPGEAADRPDLRQCTLRSIVRQDPDVIMIGEIRDLETAQIAVQSALTAHMVLSTLHTNDAASSVNRLSPPGSALERRRKPDAPLADDDIEG